MATKYEYDIIGTAQWKDRKFNAVHFIGESGSDQFGLRSIRIPKPKKEKVKKEKKEKKAKKEEED